MNNETTLDSAESQSPISGSLQISDESENYLNSTRRWSSFLSILGFIFIGLIVMIALYFMTMFSSLDTPGSPIPVTMISFIYVLMGVLHFFPIFYLFKFSTFMNNALKQKDSVSLELAFRNLKSHYKFVGIFVIVILSIYIIAGVGFLFIMMSR